MSDLVGVSGTSGARGTNGAVPRQPATATGASPLRTPRDIMRNRELKEQARVRREAEEAAAAEAERQRRIQEDEMRRTAERRSAGAGLNPTYRDSGYRSAEATSAGAGATSGQLTFNTPIGQPTSAGAPASSGRVANPDSATTPRAYDRVENNPAAQRSYAQPSSGARQRYPTTQPQDNPKLVPTSQPTAMTTSARLQTIPNMQQQPAQTSTGTRNPTGAATGPTAISQHQTNSQVNQPVITGPTGEQTGRSGRDSNVSSFPHAFERWENLSSRWEGLTSYWIRKLESNPQRADINQEMARQITDLAAAGANLFHAVVELQRLRASSERKFQRWFFDTRTQQEEAQETQARLQRALEQERARRNQAEAQLQEATAGSQINRNVERLLGEYKRELQISKDEARRAWEDLGRHEQMERERMQSLREGQIIDIGGIQVLPHHAPTRASSLQQRPATQGTSASSYQQSSTLTTAVPRGTAPEYQYGSSDPQGSSPTNTDPFSSGERQAIISPPASGTQPPIPGRATSRAPDSGTTPRTAIPPLAPQPPPTSASKTSHARTSTQPAIVLPSDTSPSAHFYSQQGAVPTSSRPPITQAPYEASRTPGHGISGSETEEEPDWELDERGNIVYDATGNPVIARGPSARRRQQRRRDSNESDEMERQRARVATAEPTTTRSGYGVGNVATSQPGYASAGAYSQAQEAEVVRSPLGGRSYDDEPEVEFGARERRAPVDYEGEGYGDEEEWGELQQSRHHHPTRLSDVPEEDERSRESRISRGSGGGMF